MSDKSTPLVIAIAGGSGSGKTTVARALLERVGRDKIAYLPHDAYYRDLSHLSPEKRADVNFDHPDSLETELLIQQVITLKNWKGIDLPVYDFKTHTRTDRVNHINPQPVIMVEGILIYVDKVLRDLFDIKIFVDTDADIRFIRRLERDVTERARTTESVIAQYLKTVRPMHMDFVEPSKRYADVIIPEGGFNQVALDMVFSHIQERLMGEGA